MYVVVVLHNESVRGVFQVGSKEGGIDFIRGAATEELGRALSDVDELELTIYHELTNNEDGDNHYTWSVNIVE